MPLTFPSHFCPEIRESTQASSPNQYPTQTAVTLLPIPREHGMDDPCAGVPTNSWCKEY